MKTFVFAAIAAVMTAFSYAGTPVGICLHASSPEMPAEKIECFEFEKLEKTPNETRFFLPNGTTTVVTNYRNRGIVLYPNPKTADPEALAESLKSYEAYSRQSPTTRKFLNPWILKLRSTQVEAAKQEEKDSALPTVTLTDGTVLKGCKAVKREATTVSLMHTDGIKKVNIAELSEATKKALDLDALPISVDAIAENNLSTPNSLSHPEPQQQEDAGQPLPPNSAATSQPQQEEHLVDRKESIAIKGLHLGMAGKNAAKTIVDQGNGRITVRPTTYAKRNGYDILFQLSSKDRPPGSRFGQIWIDPTDGAVIEFFFETKLSDFLFNTIDLNADEFAQTFIDAYEIPKLAPSAYGGVQGWRYDSPEGWTLRIMANKTVNVEKTPDRKFN